MLTFVFTTASISVMETANTPVFFQIVLVLLSVVSQFANGQNWNTGDRDVKWRMNCDFPGHDIARIASPGENCGSLCIASPKCTHFRFSPDGFCFLKDATIDSPVTNTREGSCGFIPWKFESGRDHWNSDKSGIRWLANCDFWGHDIGRSKSTGEKCGGVCLANPECNHFRFDGVQFCYLKKAPLSTSRTAVNGGACGFISWRDSNSNQPAEVNSCPNVGGLSSSCRPNVDCSLWYDVVLKTPGTSCKLANNGQGTCCPNLPDNRRTRGVFMQSMAVPSLNKELISKIKSQLKSALETSKLQFQTMRDTEVRLVDNNIVVRPGSSSALFSLVSHTTPETQKINFGALQETFIADDIVKRFGVKPKDVASVLSQISVQCPPPPVCKAVTSPYRTPDGSCNNIKQSTWGQSRTQLQRILSPDYANGIRLPRRAKNGGELPSPRLVSATVVRDNLNHPHESNSYWVTQFGQFTDHDITQTVASKMDDLQDIECCAPDGQFLDSRNVHPECLPIDIPANDPFFSRFGRRCMTFVRSAPARRADCKLGYVEQMNDNTHFLDASQVYGSDEKKAKDLRSTVNQGHLRVTHFWKFPTGHHQFDLLPADDEFTAPCTLSKTLSGIDPPSHVKCFDAGDPRSSEIPELAVTQTILMRQHNKLVGELAAQNPHRDGEHLYQEARRILIAQMQHITYNEWLPIILGRAKMVELGLLTLKKGFSNDYDPNVNPSIVNEFATVAFRFGHSLVQGKHELFDHNRKLTDSINLRNHFFKTQMVYTPGNVDKFLIGLATQPDQSVDNIVSEELTNHLFEEEGKGFGLDLVSLNIQRGRDHGIPGYNEYRVLCGLPRAKNFDDLKDHIPQGIVDQFKYVYASVDDIDFYIAGISERRAAGALVGPTFQCIIADQFLKLKQGDRFFYDLGGQSGSFTESQLQEIRKISWARIICDNSNIQTVQPLLFKSVSGLNPIVNCDSTSIPRMDLGPWASRTPKEVWHVGEGGVQWHLGCDFTGHDVSNQATAGENCGRLCISESRCNAFSFHQGKCFLKNIPTELRRSPAVGGICGFLPWKF